MAGKINFEGGTTVTIRIRNPRGRGNFTLHPGEPRPAWISAVVMRRVDGQRAGVIHASKPGDPYQRTFCNLQASQIVADLFDDCTYRICAKCAREAETVFSEQPGSVE